jgi:hypothetical protein
MGVTGSRSTVRPTEMLVESRDSGMTDDGRMANKKSSCTGMWEHLYLLHALISTSFFSDQAEIEQIEYSATSERERMGSRYETIQIGMSCHYFLPKRIINTVRLRPTARLSSLDD